MQKNKNIIITNCKQKHLQTSKITLFFKQMNAAPISGIKSKLTVMYFYVRISEHNFP